MSCINVALPVYADYMYMFATCIAYTASYIILNNCVRNGEKLSSNLLEICVVFTYTILTFTTTGRTEFMYLCIYCVSLYLMMQADSPVRIHLKFSILIKGLLVVSAFFVSFYLLGNLTGKAQISTFEETISLYVGGSIAAFGKYMDAPVLNINGSFGEHTLFGIYSVLRNFIKEINILDRPLEFIQIGNTSTNIYTALRRYMQDFGYIGCVCVMVMIGFVFGKSYSKTRNNNAEYAIIRYAMMIFVAIEMSIEERFFMTLVTPGFLYKLIIMYLIMKYLNYKYARKVEV